MKHLAAVLLLLLVTACASTPFQITGTGTDAQGKPTAPPALPLKDVPTLVTDLQSAAFNLDQAVAIGALPEADPAANCLHGILIQAGIEVPSNAIPPKSFTPKNDGLVSLGAIAYIQVQQAKAALPLTVPVDCKALIGQFVIDGIGTANKIAPNLVLRGLGL